MRKAEQQTHPQQFASPAGINANNSTTSSNNANTNTSPNKNLLEQQLNALIGQHYNNQFVSTANSSTNNPLLLNNQNSNIHQQLISPPHGQYLSSRNLPLHNTSTSSLDNIIINNTSTPNNMKANNNTIGSGGTSQQDMLINMLFSQPTTTTDDQIDINNNNNLVQNLMMSGFQNKQQLLNQSSTSTNNNLLTNLDMNPLYQTNNSNQYIMPNNNNIDTMTQLLLSDVNNFMNKPTNNPTNIVTQNSQNNDELLQQIISTLQSNGNNNNATMFNNNLVNNDQQQTNNFHNLPPALNNATSMQQDSSINNSPSSFINSNGLTETKAGEPSDEHVPHLGSVELNQDPNKLYFPIACVNCRGRHKKCDKMYPSCSQCIKRGVDCLYRSPKKKGRHNQQSSTKANKNSSLSTTVALHSNTRYQPYPQSNKNSSSENLNVQVPDELKRLLASQMGYSNNIDHQQFQGINLNEVFSQTSQLPIFQNQIAEKLNIAAYRKKTIELYEGVISLGYSLVDINLIEQALFESESIDSNSNYSPEILSLLYSIHAVTCQALGQDQAGFLSFQKAKNCLANFFDSWSNILVATTYCHLSIYCASKGDSDTAKFYLNFVDFYFGNRHKIDFDRLEEYVIDSNDNGSLRDLMVKHSDNPNIKNIMSNLGINSSEFLLQQPTPTPTRHIYERLPKEADFKLLKFRILCGITLDSCGKEQYPVMLRIDPPIRSIGTEASNDLSLMGKISPEGSFHLTTDGITKMDSSNFKRYSFSSYFCKILADMHLYITGRIPKHVLHMLTEVQPTLDNLSTYMEIIDNLSKIYREHEKRRKFNDIQLPLALCIFNLFVFGTKLFLIKEVYRKTKATQKNTSPNTTTNNKGVLNFLHSEILKLSNVVTKCTTIENFELLKPNLMNSVASAAEVHLALLESFAEISHLPLSTVVDTLELSNYFTSTFSAQDIQNPLAHKQILTQFEQQLLDMIDLNINALVTWRDRYGNDKYTYLIERMELFKHKRSNQLFESIQMKQFSSSNLLSSNSYNHEDNYSMHIPAEIQQNMQGPEIYKLANFLLGEIERNKL